MNPLASFLDHHEGVGEDGWRYSLRTFAVAILLLGLPPVTVMKRPTRVRKRQEYEEMDGEDEEGTEPKPFISKDFVDSFYALSVTWVLTITLISYGIFIPKIHFVGTILPLPRRSRIGRCPIYNYFILCKADDK
jgi:hypothetical protein